MPLLLIPFAIGSLLLAAAMILLPYRIRFLRRLDRAVFASLVSANGALGAVLMVSAGSMLILEGL